MKKGFTLVELSIVLVIIGLLIGGILVGQSMIESAKISSTVREIGQLNAAVYSFQSRYNSIPGDSKSFSGDGNNMLTDSGCVNSMPTSSADLARCADRFSGEIGSFWSDLSTTGFGNIDFVDSYAGGSLDISTGTQNVPVSKINDEAIYLAFSPYSYSSLWEDTYYSKPHFMIASIDSTIGTSGSTNAGLTSSTTPVQMLALDTKLDDGIPRAGILLLGSIGGLGELRIGHNNGPACLASGAVYNTSLDEIACTPAIVFDIFK